MKLDRLLAITMTLLTRRRITATELATRYEVSVRTIYRDIDLINQSGIPVVSFLGADGGFELMSGHFLTKQHFSIEDFSMIYHLLKGVEGAVGGLKYTTLINKLITLQPALLNKESKDKITFDISASDEEKAVILPLLEAIDQLNRVMFTYTNASGQLSERTAEPLNLLWEQGNWYMDAYCLLRQDTRFFRVSRIEDLKVLKVHFHPRSEYKRPEQKEGIDVHLRFDLSAQPRVYEQFPGEFTHQGDFIDVQTVFYSKDYAVSVILSYGSKVKIISPDDLKDDLMKQIRLIQNVYGD